MKQIIEIPKKISKAIYKRFLDDTNVVSTKPALSIQSFSVTPLIHSFPKSIVSCLSKFSRNPNSCGYLLIKNFPSVICDDEENSQMFKMKMADNNILETFLSFFRSAQIRENSLINFNVEVTDFTVLRSINSNLQKGSKITIVNTKKALSSLTRETFSKLLSRVFTKRFDNHSIKYSIVQGKSGNPEIMFNENELIIKNSEEKKIISELKNALNESSIELEFDNGSCLFIPSTTCTHARSDFRTDYLTYGFNAFIPRSIFDKSEMTIIQNKKSSTI